MKIKNFRFRKKILIYPLFQLTLIGVNCAILGIMFGVISIQISSVLRVLDQKGIEINLEATHPYFHFLQMESTMIHTRLAWGFFACAVFSNLAILLISHKVSGPIVRLIGYFRTVSTQGRDALSPLAFRYGDFFGELPPLVKSAFRIVLSEAPQDETFRD